VLGTSTCASPPVPQPIDVLGGMLGGVAVLNFFITVDGAYAADTPDHCVRVNLRQDVHSFETDMLARM